MRKNLFCLIALALFTMPSLVKADIYYPWFELYQDYITYVDTTGTSVGDYSFNDTIKAPLRGTLIGEEDSIFGLKPGLTAAEHFLYTTPGVYSKDTEKYTALTDFNSRFITLVVNWQGNGSPTTYTSVLPAINVEYTITTKDGGETEVKEVVPYRKGIDPDKKIYKGVNDGKFDFVLDSVHNRDNARDSTWYYVLDFEEGIKLNGTLTLDYGPGQEKQTAKVELTRDEDHLRFAELKALDLFEIGTTATITAWPNDEQQVDLKFDENNRFYDYTTEEATNFVVRWEPKLAGSQVSVFLDGVSQTTSAVKSIGAYKYIVVGTKGGLVEIEVTAPNKSKNTKKYTLNIVSTAPVNAPGADEGFTTTPTHPAALIKRLYFTDGTKDYEVWKVAASGIIIGKFDGTVSRQDTTYKAGVPDALDPNLEPKVEIYSDQAVAFSRDKYKVFYTPVLTGLNPYWVVELKKLKAGKTNLNSTVADDWEDAKQALRGGNSSDRPEDSIASFKVNLLNNDAGLSTVEVLFDSLTATPVVFNKVFSSEDLEYVAKGDIAADVKRVFLVAKANTTLSTVKANWFGDKAITKDTTELILPSWPAGENQTLVLTSTAQDSTKLKYNFTFKKAYDLSLASLALRKRDSQDTLVFYARADLATERSFEYSLKPDENNITKIVNLELKGVFTDADRVKHILSTHSYISDIKDDYYVYTYEITPTLEGVDPIIYTVKLIKPRSVATLDFLYVSKGVLEPEFSPEIYAYTLSVDADLTEVRIIAAATDANATVTAPNKTYALKNVATQTIEIKVVASDEVTDKTYTIAVLKDIEDPTGLSSISSSALIISNNGSITVTSPYRERIYVHSLTGTLLTAFDKNPGSVTVPSIASGLYIFRGSNGWVTKTLVK